MQRIFLKGLGAETSALGFGCASLGSRVSETAGLAALTAAFDAGVGWYDIAPAYGAGAAEAILGRFVKTRRDSVQICTKVGLLPPPQSATKRILRSALRPVVNVAKPLRTALRGSAASQNRAIPLTPEGVTASIEGSLRRLGTDHVDVYALHNAAPEDLSNDALLRALEDLLAAGKARAIAVAGGIDTAQAAIAAGGPVRVVQFAQPPAAQEAVFAAAAAAGIGCVTHSVFGIGGALGHLTARLRAEPALLARLAAAGFSGPPEAAAAALLLARAREANGAGVILLSMFSARSRERNLSAPAPLSSAAALCADLGI